MARLPVVKLPEKSLRERSVEVDPKSIGSSRVQKLIDDMIETMKHEKGVGIAAPQVAVNERIIIVDTPDGPDAFINPVIVKASKKKNDSHEGCLSIPGHYDTIRRHERIKLVAFDRKGDEVEISAQGFPAIVFQHEVDHLEGTVFIDRIGRP
jgi:peptide deformylase